MTKDHTTTDQSLSFSPTVIKITRHRSVKTKNRRHLITKKRSNKVIHIAIRGTTDSSSLSPHFSTDVVNDRRQNEGKETSTIGTSMKSLKSTKNFVSVARIHPQHSSLSQSSQNKQQDDHLHKTAQKFDSCLSRTDTHDEHKPISNDIKPRSKSSKVAYNKGIINDTLANTMDYINKENKNLNKKKKKKKKCRRTCVILFLLGVFILSIVITALLVVFLVKPKTTSPTNTATPILRWNSAGITVAGISGVSGSTSDKLNNPWGLVLDYDNTLYIADRSNNRIQKYIMGSTIGSTVAGQANGASGVSTVSLDGPAAIIRDVTGDLYIADGYNHRIQFWANGASAGVQVAGTGTAGSAGNELQYPYGIDRNLISGTLYIADTLNNRIMSYISGNSSGSVIIGGNGNGLNNTQLNTPIAVYFDSFTNSIIIVNYGNNNIVRSILGESKWTLVAGDINGFSGNTSTLFNGPMGLTLDPMGNLYVADRYNHRIQFFSVGQSTGTTIAGANSQSGNSSLLFNQPYTISLDTQLNLYVSDNQNHRVQKFLRY